MTEKRIPPQTPTFLPWMVLFGVLSGAVLLLFMLPVAQTTTMGLITWLLVAVAMLTITVLAARAGANPLALVLRSRIDTQSLPLAGTSTIPRLQVVVEIAFVCVVALYFTREYFETDATFKLSGYEAEWLTNSVQTVYATMRDYGYFPLWQPYLEYGEPLINNPFSFVLNPFSSVPSLLFGPVLGIKYSAALAAVIAGVGGWFMGRVLGMTWAARLLLGALLAGKGNMVANLGAGYFQLGVAQAYFPWVIGGTLVILRQPDKRWGVVLTAVSFMLLFFAGNIWYTLPMLICMAVLAMTHVVRLSPPPVHGEGEQDNQILTPPPSPLPPAERGARQKRGCSRCQIMDDGDWGSWETLDMEAIGAGAG